MPGGDRLPAIVIGGEMIGLSVARSLSAAGVPVDGIGHRDDPLRFSRHRRSFTAVAGGAKGQEDVIEWLRRGPREGVILPCSDEALELVARNRSLLTGLGYTPIEADDEALAAMLDKTRTAALARRLEIDSPRVASAGSLQEARDAADEIGYPCALKPIHSHRFARHFGLDQKVFVAKDSDQLEAAFDRTENLPIELMVTEIIPGPDDAFASYYSYLDEQGTPLFHITKRKLRQFPPRFGLGCFHVTDWNPEVAELGLRFLQGAGVRGLACVEFKRDVRDGRLKLIECNHRFTAATEQLRVAGADVALLTYNRLVGIEGPTIDGYRTGVGYWFPLRDARAFLEYRSQGELTFGQWARSLIRRQCFPVASLDDPLPSIAQSARRLGRRLRPQPGANR